ncbi:MAG: serine/threonine protein kinase, partial [Thermoguttaceae bacterium]|nr:serine/threonine protein kinase [Thermoguttaceae bacterium]
MMDGRTNPAPDDHELGPHAGQTQEWLCRESASDSSATWQAAPAPEGQPAVSRADSDLEAVDERHLVVRQHAQGGLGEVFLAIDRQLNRHVALKRIRDPFSRQPAYRGLFLAEAEITGRLEHPGIVPVYAVGTDPGGRPYYSMRFIRGETLEDAVGRFHRTQAGKAESAVAFRKLLRDFVAVCNVIAYAHSRGILHRDLKPSNIMLGKFGEVIVVDWGLARPIMRPTGDVVQSDDESAQEFLVPSGGMEHLKSTGGTPQYMSPEQALGHIDELGPASDIYSLGATLYYILTARTPMDDDAGKGPSSLHRRASAGDARGPRDVRPDT